MKKLLTILGAVGLTATAGAGVVSCGTEKGTDKDADKAKTPEVVPSDSGKDKDESPVKESTDDQIDKAVLEVDKTSGQILSK